MEKKNNKKNIIIISAIAVLAVLFLFFVSATSDPETLGLGNVALIKVSGIITAEDTFSLGEQSASSSHIVESLKEAEENPQVKAILVEINSPGGSAVASEEIAMQLKAMKKPKIALIRDVGASGGYWVASAADTIVASPVSITGSIGVTASYLQFTGLMEKYGVSYQELTAGEHKDMGSPFRNLTKEEQKLFRKSLDETRDYFVHNVAENRNMSFEQVDKLATGEIYLGKKAKEVGLIDELGGREKAEEIIKIKTGIKEIVYKEYEDENSLFYGLSSIASKQSFHIGQGIGSAITSKTTSIQIRT